MLPLWAIVESRGGFNDDAYARARRLERLPMLADQVRVHALDFLLDQSAPAAPVAAVVRQNSWESSDEGRAARRHLP